MNVILVIDGGTTNLRITLLDENLTPLKTYRDETGVRLTAIDGNNSRLRASVRQGIHELMDKAGVDDILYAVGYGMLTSGLGLYEVPHLTAPADVRRFHDGMVMVEMPEVPCPLYLIPGLRNHSDPITRDNAADMDMMRGEETETVGLIHLMQLQKPCMLVLPGSHNKFISIGPEGSLRGCMTSISGELLDVLTHHTIIKDAVKGGFTEPEEYDRDSFLFGVEAAAAGLGRAAFETRILTTLGDFTIEKARSFLLGTVLRMDLDALYHFRQFDRQQTLYIAGKKPVSQALYDLFLSEGLSACLVPDEIRARMGTIGACRIMEYHS